MIPKTLIDPAPVGLALALALLLSAAPATAQEGSPAALLEEAVYLEETVGDLDKAVEIYERIAADAEARRPLVARALHNLYRCYREQGDEIRASATFSRLRKEYPDYEELLGDEIDDLPSTLELEPVPWLDNEVQVLGIRLSSGLEVGAVISHNYKTVVEGEDAWSLGMRRFVPGSPENQGMSRVEVRQSDFTPIQTHFRHSQIGAFHLEYHPDEVVFHTFSDEGSRDRTMKIDRQLYDNEQAIALMRRLPLEVDYRVAVPILTTLGQVLELAIDVVSRETVEVPAGEFDCFKLEVPLVGQTFYLSSGPRREVVKIEAQAVSIELLETSQRRPDEALSFTDPDLGFSFELPGGWYTYRFDKSDPADVVSVQLLDPEAHLRGRVEAFPLAEQDDNSPRAAANRSIEYNKKHIANLEVRDKSWAERAIGGQPATSWVSDYENDGKQVTRHETVIIGETHLLKITFVTPLDRFDGLRATFDEIVEGMGHS
jgi:hypothetical protein